MIMNPNESATDQNSKLIESIKKFSTSYKALSNAGKTAFENQIRAQMRTMDARNKKLYEALLESTKKDLNIDQTIKEMEKADKAVKSGL